MANKIMHHVVIGENTYEIVDQYAREHGGVTIDSTLTQSGQAADAKATGDAIGEVEGDVSDLDGIVNGTDSINFLTGKAIDTSGALVDDADRCVSEKIPYTWTGSTRYYTSGDQSTCRIAFYDAGDSLLKSFVAPTPNVEYRSLNAEEQITGTVAYVRISFMKNYTAQVVRNVTPLPAAYWTAQNITTVGLSDRVETLEEQIQVEYDKCVKAKATTVTNDTITALEGVDVRKNMDIDFRGDITAFTSVTVGHGFEINYGAWLIVDSTNVTVYKNENGEQVAQYAHGLTIGHYIHVLIQQGDSTKATVVVESGSGRFKQTNVPFDSRRGDFYAIVSGTLTDVALSVTMQDLNKDIWLFGDSYQSLGDPKRYPYYLSDDGYLDNCLMSGFPGANVSHQIVSFRNLMSIAKPKYLVWTLGMNNSDTSSAINSTWQTATEEVIATCEDEGVTVILATIPNVPERVQSYKNAYVKASGKRYIDFAKAVGAESTGSSWYTGMLSTDNVHPDTSGAIALYAELLADFPEIMG